MPYQCNAKGVMQMGWRDEDKIYTEEKMTAVRMENRRLQEALYENREKCEALTGLTERESDILYKIKLLIKQVANPTWQQVSDFCDLHTEADWEAFSDLEFKGCIEHGLRTETFSDIRIRTPEDRFKNAPDAIMDEVNCSCSMTKKNGKLYAEISMDDLPDDIDMLLDNRRYLSAIFTDTTIGTILPLFPILKAGRVILMDGDGNLMKEVDETENIAAVLLPYADKAIRQFNSIFGGYEIMIADESCEKNSK